ncbi:F-box only protein 21 [Camponotus floridanus]|uniref:F-box only protein 21 n=1 Tax=Camponotus floridanus TaxID=104421 RepID=E2AD96_CAMFO|nr:F-box only protein 21 [Camponotus floridanus]
MSKEKRLFERLIIIMTQHCQPYLSYSVIKTFLDDMAYEVFSLVKNKYPKHSLFSTSPEQISFWRDNNIERNFWNRTEAMQIIEILEEFMSELGYCKLNKLLKTLDIACEFVMDDRPDIFFERSEDPKRRNEEIKFAIGMIIKHTSPVEYNIKGVIVGWHYECDSVFTNLLNQLDDIDPISNLNHPLISGNLYLLNKLTTIESCFCRESRTTDCMKQPHYLILTDSNQIRYVEQNTICSTNKRLEGINNVEIGRYFTRFEDTHYVPNENLAKLYPDDAAAILEILSSQ